MIYCCESYLTMTGNPYNVGRPGGADELVKIYDEAGITGGMVLLSGADAVDNRTVWEATKKYPKRIFGMCLVRANRGQAAVDEFKMTVKEWGFKGLKHGAEADDLAKAAADMEVPITIHTGGESWNPKSRTFFENISAMAAKYPALPIIMEHMGYRYAMDLAIEVARSHKNVYLGTTIPAASEPYLVRKAVEEAGADKVVFGSNAPFALADLGVEGVRRLKLAKADEELVFSGNFRRIYRLKD